MVLRRLLLGDLLLLILLDLSLILIVLTIILDHELSLVWCRWLLKWWGSRRVVNVKGPGGAYQIDVTTLGGLLILLMLLALLGHRLHLGDISVPLHPVFSNLTLHGDHFLIGLLELCF